MSRPLPPVESRFRKGVSGNPAGRPRKTKSAPPAASAFDVVIDKTLTITQGGREREVTVEEALQHKLYQEAVAGSRLARRQVLKMIAKREKAIAAKSPAPRHPVEVRFERNDPDNADRALQLLGIASLDESRRTEGKLLLETWAVQAALSRGCGLELRDSDVALIRNSVREPDALRALKASRR